MTHAGVAIRSLSPNQRHLGILHRDPTAGETRLLHLAWHHELRDQVPGKAYVWVNPPIPGPRLRQVAAMCRLVDRRNPDGIPYAFSAPNDCFDEQTGKFLFGPTNHGLTCATFVCAVFESVGLKLLDFENWPVDRDGDREWQEAILTALKSGPSPASPEHIQAVRDEIGSVRIRPEQVAGAATVEDLPSDFTTASQRAEGILGILQSHS